ncbi:unnamed protein product [Blepharisma stoltei]|uniref:Uncharacterized protein n=1 Tax=Blepharisma stoltei TaxID=1481888 RepID=A0AAU9JVA2_9CILI|nr:unnamed protein product [Blepharisma stoltei]
MTQEIRAPDQAEIDEFCVACGQKDLQKVSEMCGNNRILVEQCDSKLSLKPLFHAVFCGSYEVTYFLLEKGSDPNCRNAIGETPLHQAADNSELRLVRALLEFNANPNLKTNDGETPLHQATFRGDVGIVELLLLRGANPNEKNSVTGKTSLHIAAECEQVECLKMLLDYGAEVSITDNNGKFPAELTENSMIVNILDSYYQKFDFDNGSSLFSVKEAQIGDEETASTVRSFQGSPQHSKYMSIAYSIDSEMTLFIGTDTINDCKSETTGSSINGSESFLVRENCNSINIFEGKAFLLKFLKNLKLERYFQVLVDSGFDDLDSMIDQMKTPLPITREVLSGIGIEKPGHIFRLLMGLEYESGIYDTPLSEHYDSRTNLMLNDSKTEFQQWLESIKLGHLFICFEESGYDDIEMNKKLMFSRYPITDEVLKNEVGIDKRGYRYRILGKIHEEILRSKCPVLLETRENTRNCSPSCSIF